MRALVPGAFLAALSLCAQPQEAQVKEVRGIPARAAASDYQSHAQAGNITIAADFDGHDVPTPDQPFSTESSVAIEVALFGPAGATLKLSLDDFALRINGKKEPLSSQPVGLVVKSLKDPSWQPPEPASKGSKTSIGGGGGGGAGQEPAVTPHMPFELQLAMQVKVQKAALPEGERPLPVAGLIFFQYSGKTKGIRSIELLYNGPAGKATIPLEP